MAINPPALVNMSRKKERRETHNLVVRVVKVYVVLYTLPVSVVVKNRKE